MSPSMMRAAKRMGEAGVLSTRDVDVATRPKPPKPVKGLTSAAARARSYGEAGVLSEQDVARARQDMGKTSRYTGMARSRSKSTRRD